MEIEAIMDGFQTLMSIQYKNGDCRTTRKLSISSARPINNYSSQAHTVFQQPTPDLVRHDFQIGLELLTGKYIEEFHPLGR